MRTTYLKKFVGGVLAGLLLSTGIMSCDSNENKESVCGDGFLDDNEVCDGTDLNNHTCSSLGYGSGELKCNLSCSDYDYSSCQWCGNNKTDQDSGEVCDGINLNDQTCSSLDFGTGQLACKSDCSDYDKSACQWCGDGKKDPGEDHITCCVDAGCDSGICLPDIMACVDPWLIDCPDAETSCSTNQPWQCQPDDLLPQYNCGACGCPSGEECRHQICYLNGVADMIRSDPLLPGNYPLDEYFEFFEWAISAEAMTFAEFSDLLDDLLHEDARRVAIVMGETHGSPNEQMVAIQLMRDIQNNGWNIFELGIENNSSPLIEPELLEDLNLSIESISGNLTNVSYCDAAKEKVSSKLNYLDGIYLQYTGSGHTSKETAHHRTLWTICSFPHTTECVLTENRLAINVILFDPFHWCMQIDRALAWELYYNFPTERDGITEYLDQTIARWHQTMDAQVADPLYNAVVNGEQVNVRLVQSQFYENIFIAYLPRPQHPAYIMEGYRALWQDPTIQDFLFTNEISPARCSMQWQILPEETILTFFCNNGDNSMQATVNGETFTITEYSFGT
jgi:hypothetical protein